MKRFITYVYIYDKGEKQKNTGFIKVDVADDVFKLDIRIQNIGRFNGRCPVLIMAGANDIAGIKIGELDVRRGSGNGQYILDRSGIKNSKYTFEDVMAIRINISERTFLASCWKDNMADMIMQKYKLWNEPDNQPQPANNCGTEESSIEPRVKKTLENQDVIRENPELESEHSDATFTPDNELKKIDVTEIKSLPKKNWYLCNNSFLLHGFFSYHYLVIKEKEENGQKKYYLGVPGIYERPEKAMALLFGFPEFEAEKSNKPEPVGEFGYWYCLLDM